MRRALAGGEGVRLHAGRRDLPRRVSEVRRAPLPRRARARPDHGARAPASSLVVPAVGREDRGAGGGPGLRAPRQRRRSLGPPRARPAVAAFEAAAAAAREARDREAEAIAVSAEALVHFLYLRDPDGARRI